MTNQEYRSAYLNARDSVFPAQRREYSRIVRDIYINASEEAVRAVRNAELDGLGELTQASRNSIDRQLQDAANEISQGLTENIPEWEARSYQSYLDTDSEYILRAAADAGADDVITQAGIDRINLGLNRQLINSITARQFQDGFTLSQRIWSSEILEETLPSGGIAFKPVGVNGDYQWRMLNVVDAGIAQGRDLFDISQDLNVYLRDGKTALVNRYGILERGSGVFRRRISDQCDWRAVRLIRSELYAGLQDAAVRSGRANPAVVGQYDWRLTPGVMHDCVCRDLAAASPYAENEVPAYPHPNCLCQVIPRLRNRTEFVEDLRSWVNGVSVEYIDNWHRSYYRSTS